MARVNTAETRQVEVATARTSSPAADNTAGLTAMMYDMTTKVVMPARISVWTLVPCSRRRKNPSSPPSERPGVPATLRPSPMMDLRHAGVDLPVTCHCGAADYLRGEFQD